MGRASFGLRRLLPWVAALAMVCSSATALASSFIVTDGGDGLPSGTTPCSDNLAHCTLRMALVEANNHTGPHFITFDPTVVQVTLSYGASLDITSPITITGNPVTRTIINGNGLYCFLIGDAATAENPNGGNGTTIQNLVIQNCHSDGIAANGHDLHFINNYIGTDITGTMAAPNTGIGISVSSSHVYTLGPSVLTDIYNALPFQPVDPGDVSNFVNAFSSNLVTALTALTQPVYISGNLISGNGGDGIMIFSENLAGTIVSGNRIGTDITGNIAIANGGSGIRLVGGTFGNLIGPDGVFPGNLISGNKGYGIEVAAGAVVMPNFIIGNRIGLPTLNGNHIGNEKSGIYVSDASPQSDPTKPNPSGLSLMIGPLNVIADNQGGSSSSDADYLANTEAGIYITGASTKGVKVVGNTIGAAEFPIGTALQSSAYGNAGDGIRVTANGNTIGGTSSADANIVVANKRHGIVVSGAAGNNILGNQVGVHPAFAGNLTLGNAFDGIHIDHGDNTTVGGAGATDGNRVAGNGRNGIRVMNGDSSHGWGNLLQRNIVYGNSRSAAGVGIDLDHPVNAADGPHSEYPSTYANLDQAPLEICLGSENSGPCSGSAAAATSAGSTSIAWTVATHGPANFRVEFFAIDASDNNSATTMNFLGEALVDTDLLGNLLAASGNTSCSGSLPGRCVTTLSAATGGNSILATITDVTPITSTPSNGGDWKGQLQCLIGNLGIILPTCTVNNTSEFAAAVAIAADAPLVTTGAASAIDLTAATLNGTVTSNGAATTVGFEYGLDTSYGSSVTAVQSPLAANAASAAASATVGSLNCNTQYHFRITGNNGVGGTMYGADQTFTTAACAASAPTVATSAATSVAATTATLNGTVSSNGAATTVNFDYGTTAAYGSSAPAAQSPLSAGATGAAVSVAVTSLTCNTLYHFHVSGDNGVGGTVSGGDQTFTTAACAASAPSVSTGSASAVAATTATVNGTVSANGAATTVTFEYGLTTSYGSSATAAQSPLSAGSANAAVSAGLAGLTCAQTYHFRVNGNNGVGGTINGADQSFTTAACAASAPTVTTSAASSVTLTTATLNGTVSSNGAATTVTFEYGLNTSYGSSVTAAQSPLALNAANAAVSAAVSSLTCNTQYHFRVNGNNGVGGTINGADQTFTTAACAASSPTVTSGAASSVAATTATLNGTVSSNGAATTVTFDYGLDTSYGSSVTAAQSPLAAGAANAAVSAPVSSLTCNTQYHFRVNGNNGVGGTINGADQTFTTAACPASAPTVTTVAASSVTAASATLNGTVSSNGAATTVSFEYGLNTSYGSSATAAQSPLAAGAANAAVSAAVASLTCNTQYHFRVNGNNGVGGTINGADQTFTTAACPASAPTVTTAAATSVGATSATLNGTISSNGAATTVSFEYGLSTSYGSSATAAQSPLAAGAANAAVSAAVASLTCNTLYHFRVNGNNGVGGTINGADQTFTTASCAPSAPTVTTAAATSVGATSATLNGTVSSNGAATTVSFEYGLNTSYGSSATAAQSPLAAGAANAAVSAAVASLTCNTLYHFRVNGNNGVGGTINGADQTFTTASCAASAPTVTTAAATSVGATSATLNGTASANGAATTVSFEYGTTAAYGSSVAAAQSPLAAGAANAAVTAALGSLTCNTLYHYRVTGNNGVGGTVNGADQTFTTAACPNNTYSGITATGTTGTAVITSGPGCSFSTAQFVPVSPAPPPGLDFPHGLFAFTLAGCTHGATATIQITYSTPVSGATYQKYGPRPPAVPAAWYAMPGAIIAANTVTFSITDGQIGDDDLAADGSITDAGGPAVSAALPATASVPTLSEMAMLLLTALIGLATMGRLPRRVGGRPRQR
jgi:hypothetical protein